MVLDLNKEMAWVTFVDDGFETKWFPISTITGNQLEWSDSNRIMNLCREKFNDKSDWVSFGIAPTSQMLMKNSVKDNL
jgi:hypothetical protein